MREASRSQIEESPAPGRTRGRGSRPSAHERGLMVAEVTLWLVLTTGGALELLGRMGQPWSAGILLGASAGAVAWVRLRAARRFPGSERVPLSLLAVVLTTVVVLAGTLVLWAAVMLAQA